MPWYWIVIPLFVFALTGFCIGLYGWDEFCWSTDAPVIGLFIGLVVGLVIVAIIWLAFYYGKSPTGQKANVSTTTSTPSVQSTQIPPPKEDPSAWRSATETYPIASLIDSSCPAGYRTLWITQGPVYNFTFLRDGGRKEPVSWSPHDSIAFFYKDDSAADPVALKTYQVRGEGQNLEYSKDTTWILVVPPGTVKY